MKRIPCLLIALIAIASSPGCVTLHERDEATIRGVERAIEARTSDYDRWKKEMAKEKSSERDLAGIQALQDSELDRLKKLLDYEKAKQGKETP